MCPIYSRSLHAGMYSLLLIHSAPSSDSADDYMTALIIFSIFNTDPLLGVNSVLLDINKCPHDFLMDFVFEG